MRKTTDRVRKAFYPLVITVTMMLVAVSLSYAGSKILGTSGETGYSAVKYIGEHYLITDDGHFKVSEDTRISNEYAEEINLSDVKKTCMVNIQYARVKGELTALEIMVKFMEEYLQG